MSAKLHFELPRSLVLSANDRKHFHEKAPITRNLRAMGARAARDVAPMERASITIRIGWPDKRRRDADNISPTTKALIDGAVDAGILPDDSDAHVISVTKAGYVAGRPGITVLDFEFLAVEP
jgi:Holliday junction resolvase RusA-like endonuclease